MDYSTLLCPALSLGVCSNYCPLRWWCCLTISSSASSFSFCLQFFQHQGLFHESTLHIKWPKYWSFSISPSNEYSGLISFRVDWFDLLAQRSLQGTFKSLLHHHNSTASILRHSPFFTVQLSHLHMATGKTIALTTRTFVSKVLSLLFNMLSRFVITFFPGSKHLLISWLQSLSTVILKPTKIKSITVSLFTPSVCCEVMEPDAMILVLWMLSFKLASSLSSFTSSKGSCSSSWGGTIRVISSVYLRLLLFLPGNLDSSL